MAKNRKKEYTRVRGDSGQHRRILAAAAVLGLVAFVPVAIRLYDLMILNYDYYADLALRNQTRTTQVTAERGAIYDRNMHVLACSRTVENVYLDPHELKQSKADLEAISQTLGELLEREPAWILKQAQDTSMRYKQLAANVDQETADKIRQYINQEKISGIHLEPSSERYYPNGTLAAQVIGFTNASNDGVEGIEAAYNSYLKGSTGKVVTTKGNNEMDMPFSYEGYLTSQTGCSVVLTLDTTVQACLERELEEAIARYDVQNGAFGIVMNVNTGEVLAMATLGSYDPNNYREVSDPVAAAQLEKLKQAYLAEEEGTQAYQDAKAAYDSAKTAAQLKQWRNRCISDGYEPGSTFKVMTLAAALDAGAVTLDSHFSCSGAERIPGRAQLLHCWRSAGHGGQSTAQALQNSCNLAFAHIGLKLGGSQFYSYVKNFGILEKTGIDLNGESKGVFFDQSMIVNTDKWGTASLTSASFGQTFKLTAMQLVRGIAAVVNGGNVVEPYIVSEVIDENGNTVFKQEPTVLRQVISQQTSDTMNKLLLSVVEEGTAKNAQVAGYSIGGKTGTSEKIDVFDENGQRVLDKIVSFVGVAPMEDPEYIVLVALDTPSRETGIYISGGVMAAPTCGAVMEAILPYLGVEPNYTPEDAAGRQILVENMVGMTKDEAQKALNQLGLTAQFKGSGDTVTAQIPAAGQTVPGNSQLLLYLGEEPETEQVSVPNFIGMNRQQASDAAGKLGLYILVSGNSSISTSVTVTAQSVAKDTQVDVGTTIRLEFADTQARD